MAQVLRADLVSTWLDDGQGALFERQYLRSPVIPAEIGLGRVDPDQVAELERAHPKPPSHSADPIDLLDGGDALRKQPLSLQKKWPAGAVDEEPGAVDRLDHDLAHRLTGGARHGQSIRRGVGARDHLQQSHQRCRVEEVHAHDPLGPLCGGRDRGHQQG